MQLKNADTVRDGFSESITSNSPVGVQERAQIEMVAGRCATVERVAHTV